MNENAITIVATINAPIETVWESWVEPKHIVGWAFAADDWEAKNPENDVRVGGKFKTTMAAKDGSASFDFTGEYTQISEHELIEYTMDDGRKVSVRFENMEDGQVKVTQTFEPEGENPAEYQQDGWQAILDNFKKYVEKTSA